MPPPEYNPLAPTKDQRLPTELPQGRYDVAVFDNRFPSMSLASHDAPTSIVDTLPADGVREQTGLLGRLLVVTTLCCLPLKPELPKFW